jgi:hypothetical protein
MDTRLFQEDQERMNEIVGIINPTSHDFTCTHDSNADRKPITYTIKSREGLMLKRYIADHVAQKLCTQILSDYKGVVTEEIIDKTLKTIKLYD